MRMQKTAAFLLCLCLLLAFPVRAAEEPVRIAFIDTGISAMNLDAAHIGEGKNYALPEYDTSDRIGHGTATAGMVLGAAELGVTGVFPEAVVIPLVVVDRYPAGTQANGGTEALCQALRDAVDLFHCRVINVSLSASEDSEALQSAVAYAEEQGAVVVAAAGNGEGVYYPAAYPTVISVGTADGAGPAAFSSSGADVLWPGAELLSVTNRARERTETVSGTSFSCACAAGLCARILSEQPELTPAEVRERIFGMAEDIGEAGYDPASGWGVLPADTTPVLQVPSAETLREYLRRYAPKVKQDAALRAALENLVRQHPELLQWEKQLKSDK